MELGFDWETLVQVCENDGLDVSLRESYSGRGMYDKDTVGVVLEEGDVTDILKAVINQATYPPSSP
jgi:phosphopantothenate synthetase